MFVHLTPASSIPDRSQEACGLLEQSINLGSNPWQFTLLKRNLVAVEFKKLCTPCRVRASESRNKKIVQQL
jgi:hypothetical protein